ncbi:hypothetical protein RQM47_12520 [Rubrivirga sp. S365]|uniref:TonB-dependent receptor-like beta-barrel domain-containing protein n=1 Tax=Rubrivirga litoralis TaxID=3075598 RepID=A0ABU3BUF3_9BACT|nr:MULTISPECIES: hypothetical protein [unclassified Rubrivirga]MDT0632921.1 hypothetical protein [Rubrivirga sp. F394]MDT7857469.1 hypothetical protein [Rubrivirga sp. S365]
MRAFSPARTLPPTPPSAQTGGAAPSQSAVPAPPAADATSRVPTGALLRAGRLGAALLLLPFLLPALAAAQTPDDERLPSLTPRVFESRGTVRVSLPDIERQPLSGFGPPPRTYVVPAEREPATRPFAPDLDALPVYVLDAPPEPALSAREPNTFRVEGGVGSHVARYGRADLAATGAAGAFFVDADYDGIPGGDVGFDQRVGEDAFAVRAGGHSFAPGRVRIEGHAVLDRYSTPATAEFGRRSRRSLGAEVGVEGFGAVRYDAEVRFEQSRLARTDGDEEATEGRFEALARAGFLDDRVRLDAAGGTASPGSGGADVQYGSAGAAVALGRGGASLVVGARVLGYDGDGGGNSVSVGPIIDLTLPLRGMTAFATNTPRLAARSLSDLAALNPFVAPDPLVVPDVLPVDARAGVEVGRGPFRARAFGIGLYAPTLLVFERGGDALYAEDYVEATVYGAGADLVATAPGGAEASAGVEYRYARTDDGDSVPFYAPFVGRAGVQVPFPRGRVGLAAYGEGPRPTQRIGGDDASAWGLVSLDARYDVYDPFSVTLRAERLVGEAERWPGFPRPPFAVMLGLRLAR